MNFLERPQPQVVGIAQDVGLGDQRDLLAAELPGVFEGVADRPLDAAAGGYLDLVGDLVRRVLVEEPAVLAIQAFGVLADDDHVDVAGLDVGQRRRHARQQPGGPEVDVLIQLEPHLEQDLGFQDPLRDLGRAARIDPDRAEKDGIVGGQLLQGRVGEGDFVFEVVLAAEGIVGGGVGEAELSSGFL